MLPVVGCGDVQISQTPYPTSHLGLHEPPLTRLSLLTQVGTQAQPERRSLMVYEDPYAVLGVQVQWAPHEEWLVS